jgi:hypothetical protein
VVIWYIFSRFGILYQEKSGNPGQHQDMEHQKHRAMKLNIGSGRMQYQSRTILTTTTTTIEWSSQQQQKIKNGYINMLKGFLH